MRLHIFLQGPLQVGKSTVIRRTVALLQEERPWRVAGLRSYKQDAAIYLTGYGPAQGGEAVQVAAFDAKGVTRFSPQAFDALGVRLLRESAGADLIVLDELGFLEQRCPAFQAAVWECLAGDTPVLGVARQSPPPLPWLEPLYSHPGVSLIQVTPQNRDALPQQLSAYFAGRGRRE